MKVKILMVALAGWLATQPSARCQTNAPATKPAETNMPAMTATPAVNDDAAATNNLPDATDATNAAPAIIPLIQFQNVPVTAAIENLARQAGINYLLDPKIGYGQPDQNGQTKPEPTLSIRWENITAMQALQAVLDNYGLQLIQDPHAKIARITVKDATAPPPLVTRVIQLEYAGASNMVEAVQSTFTDKRSRVLADNRTSQLVVVATEKEQTTVSMLIEQLDKPTRQVLIETHLYEISSNPSTSKGIDWSGTLAAQHISFGNGVLSSESSSTVNIPGVPTSTTFGGHTITTTPGSSSSTVLTVVPQNSSSPGGLTLNTASGFSPNIGFLTADGASAVLSFLNSSTEAQQVSTPRIVTLDNETATISVIQAYPVINVAAGSANNAGGSTISYTNVGTVLTVTPHVSANDYIWLRVTPQVSSFFGKDTEQVGGGANGGTQTLTADIFNFRTIDTQVLIPNANTLVMGGLVSDNPTEQDTKVPILGDIPILGYAFRSESKTVNKDNLLIFITPTILNDADFKPTTTDFLNSQAPQIKSNMDPRWDSAKPVENWSSSAATSSSTAQSQVTPTAVPAQPANNTPPLRPLL